MHGLTPEFELLVIQIPERFDRLLGILDGQVQQAQAHLAAGSLLLIHRLAVQVVTESFNGRFDLPRPGNSLPGPGFCAVRDAGDADETADAAAGTGIPSTTRLNGAWPAEACAV